MSQFKNAKIRKIEQKAQRNLADLAGQYARAKPQEREAVQAGIQFERWMAQTCDEILEGNL